MTYESEPREGRQTAAVIVSSVALALALILASLTAYLAVQVASLNNEIVHLKMAQSDLKDAFLVLDSQPPASSDAVSAPSAALDRILDFSAESVTPPVANPPASGSAESVEASSPPPFGTGYSVRVFAPAASLDKSKLDRFIALVKTYGFEIGISDNNISQPSNPSLLYNTLASETALKLSNLLKSKYPSMNIEPRASDAITENLKHVVIINLTSEAFN